MPRLQVNVDHVATVRQARLAREPDPVWAAQTAELAGADGITVHLREDRRHIQERDVEILRRVVTTRLNLEMAATEEMVDFALRIRPDEVTLVPERRQELTTEGGLDLAAAEDRVRAAVRRLSEAGITTSLFVDPEIPVIERAARSGCRAVELHTGRYAEAPPERREAELEALAQAADRAARAGLQVHAGHGLDYRNVDPVARIEPIEELNIGFAIVARAVLVGFERAVREMVERVERARIAAP